MKVSKTYICFIFILSLVCLFCSSTTSVAKIYHLTILHTNDHSGHFVKFSLPDNPDIGGMAARSTIVNIVRAEVEQAGGHVLLLSAGEVNTGTPESDLLQAEPDFKLMRMLGYDAMTIGITDVRNPRNVLMKQREWAGCPFLAANLVHKETGEPLFAPYIIKAFDGLQVAILGLTAKEASHIALDWEDLASRSIIETAQALVPQLREQADLVIALNHIGLDEPWTADDVQLAREVPGIDVIVEGFRPTITLKEPVVVGETLILQAGPDGMYVGRLDLTINSETDRITNYMYKLIPVNLKKQVMYQGKAYYMFVDTGYVEDPAVLEFIQPYLAQTHELLSQPVGEALVRLDGGWELATSQETNLVNLITDSMRAKTGAEIAFISGGGILASIEAGPITYRDILSVLPVRRTLVLLDMTGNQVMDVLSFAATIEPQSGDFLQAPSGLTWTNNRGIPEQVMVEGTPIEFDRMYKVVTTNFIASGGSYPMFKDLPHVDTGFTTDDALRDYIQKAGKVAPKVEGRLTIIK